MRLNFGRGSRSVSVVLMTAGLAAGLVCAPLAPALAAGRALPVAAARGEALPPETLVGRWEGHIELPGAKLEINFDFVATDGKVTGDLSIPQQGASDLPAPEVAVVEEGETTKVTRVTIRVPVIPPGVTFEGVLSPDGSTITGTFRQGPAALPFELKRAAPPAEAAKEALAGFKEWLEETLKTWQVPGAGVVIVKDGQVVFAEGVGLADVESGRPATADTVFAIGSCTKAFTTFALATAVRDGVLEWDKPVRGFVPEFTLSDPAASDHMTLRDMVTHRSGLPRHDIMWYGAARSREELFRGLRHLPFSKDLRQSWQYNNLMYLAAGHVLERVTGRTWEENVRERVTAPLGMASVRFSAREAVAGPDTATPYDHRELDDGGREVRRIEFREIANVGPAGSINASARDMGAWLAMLLNGGKGPGGTEVLPPEAVRDLLTPQMVMLAMRDPSEPEVIPTGYAMGWFTDVYRGRFRAHHGGNIDGFSAMMCVLPDQKIGIAVLVNMNASPAPGLVMNHALDRLLGPPGSETRRDWSGETFAKAEQARALARQAQQDRALTRVAGTSPAHALAAYAGEYEHPAYGVVTVTDSGGVLTLAWNGFALPLEHWHYDVFAVTKVEKAEMFEGQRVQFTTSMDGAVDGLRLVAEPALAPATFAKRADARLSDPAYLERVAGEYTLGPMTLTVAVRGRTLTLSVPGQPTYDLVPTAGGGYALRGLEGFTLVFVEENGAVRALRSVQPNGVFTAERRKE